MSLWSGCIASYVQKKANDDLPVSIPVVAGLAAAEIGAGIGVGFGYHEASEVPAGVGGLGGAIALGLMTVAIADMLFSLIGDDDPSPNQ